MAWSTGTATDWQDMVAKVKTAAEANGWTTDLYTTVSDVRSWIAHNSVDNCYVGIRTFHDAPSGAYNWELMGATGYAAGPWEDQPGISPGRYDAGTAALQYGAYVPMLNSTMTYWLSVDDRHIKGFVRAGSGYFSFHVGLLDAYATAGEYPLPLYVAGSTPLFDTIPSDSDVAISGLADPIGFSVGTNGPAFLRFTDGQWYTVRNSYGSGGSRTASNDVVVYPAGTPLINATRTPDDADRWMSLTYAWQNMIPDTGVPGAPSAGLYPTPGATVDKTMLVPATILMQSPSEQLVGEIRGVYWCSGSGGLSAEDTVTIGGTTYVVAQDGNKTDVWHRSALKEA